MTEQDEIEKLKEWREHHFNPGYKAGRLPYYHPIKRSLTAYVINLIELIFLLIGSGVLWLAYLLERDLRALIAAIFLIMLAVVVYLTAKRFKPLKNGELDQEEIEAGRRLENQEEK